MRRLDVIHREPFLLATLIVIIAGFFSVTTFASRAYHHKQEEFGYRWFERGEAALKRSQPRPAVDAFRNALAYSRDNDLYRLRLAQALMAANRPQEARAHLLSLWEKQPGDGTVNLELARLAAQWEDSRQVVRYYHAAIYGVWPDDPLPHRTEARFELSEYLLKHNDIQDAQAELVALAANLPPNDAVGQTRLGELFLRSGLNARSLAAFRTALAAQPNALAALAGAGEAAFRMGDYRTARHYLLPVVAQSPQDRASQELLSISELVIKSDPFERGLRLQERARRTVQDFAIVLAQAGRCPVAAPAPTSSTTPATDAGAPAASTASPPTAASGTNTFPALLQKAVSMKASVKEQLLLRNPDALYATMDVVYRMENAMPQACAPSTAEEKAMALLAAQWEAAR